MDNETDVHIERNRQANGTRPKSSVIWNERSITNRPIPYHRTQPISPNMIDSKERNLHVYIHMQNISTKTREYPTREKKSNSSKTRRGQLLFGGFSRRDKVSASHVHDIQAAAKALWIQCCIPSSSRNRSITRDNCVQKCWINAIIGEIWNFFCSREMWHPYIKNKENRKSKVITNQYNNQVISNVINNNQCKIKAKNKKQTKAKNNKQTKNKQIKTIVNPDTVLEINKVDQIYSLIRYSQIHLLNKWELQKNWNVCLQSYF